MNNMTKVAAFVGLAVVSSGALAADWNVDQTATITVAAPTMNQGSAANVTTSNQALNGIALDSTNDDLATGSQLANLTTSTGVDLNQGPSVDGSNQAINFISASDIGSTSVITQTVNQLGVSATTLTQEDTSGSGANVQGVNVADASADVDRLSQVYTESGTMTLTQSTVTTATNTQGVNIAGGVNVGLTSLNQSTTVAGAAAMTQGVGNTGGSNNQFGNSARATTGNVDNTTQAFTASNTLNLTQSAAGANNIQATNSLITDATTGSIGVTVDSTTQTTTVAAGATTFIQNVSAAGNVQAGNHASAAGDVVSLDQTFEASASTIVDFDQTPTAASNTQAGNMVELRTAGDTIDDVNQSFTSSTTATDFDQNSASGTLIQAGNLIDLNTGSALTNSTQTFTVTAGAVTMDQLGGATGNLQALNATVDAAGAGSGGTISQVLSVTAASYVMTQNNVTGSGQYGNFVGVKL